jgi:hypothetical protein
MRAACSANFLIINVIILKTCAALLELMITNFMSRPVPKHQLLVSVECWFTRSQQFHCNRHCQKLRMPSSGMMRRVALVRTVVSEECSAFIIRVTRISELETLAVTSNRHRVHIAIRVLQFLRAVSRYRKLRTIPWDLVYR